MISEETEKSKEKEKVNDMKLRELINKINSCYACISISGLCDEYRDGVDYLKCEDWYKKARDRKVRNFSIIGFEQHSFELSIVLDD